MTATRGVRVGACGAEKCGTGCADPMNCKRPLGVEGPCIGAGGKSPGQMTEAEYDAAIGVKAWDGTCARGHCPNPTGCEHDNRCRAAGVEGKTE